MVNSINIALLGNSTTEYIGNAIHDTCSNYGISANIYNSPFSQYNQEVLNPCSSLYRSNPELIIFFLEGKLLFPDWYDCELLQSDNLKKSVRIESIFTSITSAVETIQSQSSACIVINNFKVPYHSPLGVIDNKYQPGLKRMISLLNMKLEDWACSNPRIYIFDYNGLSAQFGNFRSEDRKLYYLASNTVSFPFADCLAAEYMRIILPLKFRNRKCIVLDLDNTLWGGVAGEDGLSGISLDISGPGRSFYDFQMELLNLYKRGIILAVNSKNNYEDAVEIIRTHPYMLLKFEHFAALRINWKDKVQNLRGISQELNIGLDSIVFFDDSPVEREYVKSQLPEVMVVDVPKDTCKYVDALWSIPEFESLSISAEDKVRNLMYRQNQQRECVKQQFENLDDFLASLNSKAVIEYADEFTIPRIAQLTQKTNQFNMTTKRYSVSDIQELSNKDDCLVLCCSVSDKFGDNGIVGVCIARVEDRNADIDTFLLSCRVLGRNIEYAFLSAVAYILKEKGIAHIHSKFIESAKNKANENFYSDAGFSPDSSVGPEKLYSLDLSEKLKPFKHITLIIKDKEGL